MTRSSPDTARPLDFFSENVDAWGALEWFNRLARAVRAQDAAVLAGDKMAMETCRCVAASSAMCLVRDYEQQVRAALSPSSAGTETPDLTDPVVVHANMLRGTIAKAVNSHEALVKALEDALCELSACATQMNCRSGGSVVRAIEAARQVLAVVGTGKQP